MKKIFILFYFLLFSCGYQPLYNANNVEKIEIKEINFNGNIDLGKKIFSKLPFTINERNQDLNKLIIESTKEVLETSKNSKGQTISYRTVLNVKLIMLNSENKIFSQKNFNKEFSYKDDDNKFRFKEYQLEIENNLANKIAEDLIIYLNYK